MAVVYGMLEWEEREGVRTDICAKDCAEGQEPGITRILFEWCWVQIHHSESIQ
jgi:hypothetical protein